jgi:hypothetical protein
MTHPFDKSNALNEYFTSISTLDNEPEHPDLHPLSPCELSDIVITEQDVIDQFQILKINKPPDPDKLAPKFIKAIFPSLVIPISIIFNKTIQLGQVPSDWKSAIVRCCIYLTTYDWIQSFLKITIELRRQSHIWKSRE